MLQEKIVEKITAKEQQIVKLQKGIKKYEEKITADKEKIKMIQSEIEKLNIEAIMALAKNASMDMTKIRSLVTDMVNAMPPAKTENQAAEEKTMTAENENPENMQQGGF